jgi:hypothetical protein
MQVELLLTVAWLSVSKVCSMLYAMAEPGQRAGGAHRRVRDTVRRSRSGVWIDRAVILRPNGKAQPPLRAAENSQNASDLARSGRLQRRLGGGLGYIWLGSRVGLLSAALGEFEEELLNLLAAYSGETPALADYPEPAFSQDS